MSDTDTSSVPPEHQDRKRVRSLGFSGTRNGMTDQQKREVQTIIEELAPQEVHHGDCIGADAQFAEPIAARDAITAPDDQVVIHIHPSTTEHLRANTQARPHDIVHPPRPSLRRNRDIVRATDLLLAAPAGPEEHRSGTWFTVRFARKIGVAVIVVMLDGVRQ